jgi:hypothetical protein
MEMIAFLCDCLLCPPPAFGCERLVVVEVCNCLACLACLACHTQAGLLLHVNCLLHQLPQQATHERQVLIPAQPVVAVLQSQRGGWLGEEEGTKGDCEAGLQRWEGDNDGLGMQLQLRGGREGCAPHPTHRNCSQPPPLPLLHPPTGSNSK